MEKLCLFLVLALLGNKGICQNHPNSTLKDHPKSTLKDQLNSTAKDQLNSTLKDQLNSTAKDQLNSTVKDQPNSHQLNSIVVTKSSTKKPVPTTCIPLTTSSVEDCIRNCPVTPEYNPVCGSNNVTYDNPGRLQCAQECGVNVKLVGYFRCPEPSPAPSV